MFFLEFLIPGSENVALPPGDYDLDALMGTLPRGGQIRTWTGDGLRLACRPVPVTPEDALDAQPVIGGGGRFVLAGDFYLGARSDLAAALGLDKAQGIPDAALVMLAWERWGTATLPRLEGGYALALFDRAERALYLARGIGSYGYCIHTLPDRILVSSSLALLSRVPGLPRRANPDMLASMMLRMPGINETALAGVQTVPVGTMMRIDASGRQACEVFWHLDPEKKLRLGSDDAYVEAARDVLGRCVKDACRADGPIGGWLTSGYDSSLVMATAVREFPEKPVTALTIGIDPEAGYSVPSAREPLIAAETASRWPNATHHAVHVRQERNSLWDDPEGWFDQAGMPVVHAPNFGWYDRGRQEAARLGIRVLLGGGGGNLTLTHNGIRRLGMLARQGAWAEVVREGAALSRNNNKRWPGPWRGLWHYVLRGFLPMPMRRLGNALRGEFGWPPLLRFFPVNPAVFAQLSVHEELKRQGVNAYGSMRNHDPRFYQTALLGILDAMPLYYTPCLLRDGVFEVSPLLDRRMVEFCAAVPLEQYMSGGRARWLAERVAADRLDLTNLGAELTTPSAQVLRWHGTNGQRAIFEEVYDAVHRDPMVQDVFDMKRIRAVLDHWPASMEEMLTKTDRCFGSGLQNALHMAQFICWAHKGD